MRDEYLLALFQLLVALTESLHTAGAVNQLLFAGVKRVAIAADFDVLIADRRSDLDYVAA
jgi:hypothetical protein